MKLKALKSTAALLDGHVPSRRALWLLRKEHPCWRNVTLRTCKYLNNIVEQDHRAIKRRCTSMAGFKWYKNAGIELAHRVRKRQFSFGRGRPLVDLERSTGNEFARNNEFFRKGSFAHNVPGCTRTVTFGQFG